MFAPLLKIVCIARFQEFPLLLTRRHWLKNSHAASGNQTFQITMTLMRSILIMTNKDESELQRDKFKWDRYEASGYRIKISTSVSSNKSEFRSILTILTIFLVKSKLSTAKKSKTTTFSRVFHPKKIDNVGKSKLNIWTKNKECPNDPFLGIIVHCVN